MRKLLKNQRMQADSLPEVRGELNRMTFADVQGERVGNRPASEGHIVNAAILALAAMPEGERRAVLKVGFRVLNALLALEHELPAGQLAAFIAGANEETPGGAGAGGVTGEIEFRNDVGGAKRKSGRGTRKRDIG